MHELRSLVRWCALLFVLGASQACGGTDGSAGGGAGAGGSAVVTCHITWTGAVTGEADCSHFDVCQKNFLSLVVTDPAPPPPPLKSIQLVYSPTAELTLGMFTATGMDMVNSNVQTTDPNVSYTPQLDANNVATGDTAMTVTLSALQFSTDPNDVCAGTAHGSLTAVLPQGTSGAPPLSLHADF